MEPKKKRILLVEDEAVLRESVRDWLTEDGYDVECVETGEEALERIKKGKYGVIVLDLRLPGIDGLQVFEQAKQLEADTKGILITAFPSKESQEKARNLGLVDYLPKPFKVEELEKAISRMLGEVETGKPSGKHVWLELGAVSYRLCTNDYDCATCAFAQDIQDRFGTIAVIGADEVAKLKALPANQRLCRLASVHFIEKEKART
ncbi:MAG: response regulator [Dehalococcoidia bacterium]